MRAASPLRQIERENEMIVISHRVFCVGFRGSPWGVLPLDGMKEGSGFYMFRGFSGGGAALFVILSGEVATFIPYSSQAFIPNEGAARP